MIRLAIVDDIPNADAAVSFGGSPELPGAEDFSWPCCASCDGAMQYLGRVPHPLDAGKRVLVFQCGNEPGMCDEWDAKAGGNAAFVVESAGLERSAVSSVVSPTEGVTALDGRWSGHIETVDAESYEAARAGVEGPGRRVLGHLGGEAEWIQADETPTCASCGQRMILAAQLEEGPDHRTAMNFGGGGCGYLFVCPCPADRAAFLWQS